MWGPEDVGVALAPGGVPVRPSTVEPAAALWRQPRLTPFPDPTRFLPPLFQPTERPAPSGGDSSRGELLPMLTGAYRSRAPGFTVTDQQGLVVNLLLPPALSRYFLVVMGNAGAPTQRVAPWALLGDRPFQAAALGHIARENPLAQ